MEIKKQKMFPKRLFFFFFLGNNVNSRLFPPLLGQIPAAEERNWKQLGQFLTWQEQWPIPLLALHFRAAFYLNLPREIWV